MLVGAGGAQPRDLPPGTIFLTVRWSLSVVSVRRHPLCTNMFVTSRGEKDLTGARPDLGREPWEKWVRTQSSSWPLPQGDVGAGCWWLRPPPGPRVFLSRSAERSCFCCGLLPPMSRGREPGGPGPEHQGAVEKAGSSAPSRVAPGVTDAAFRHQPVAGLCPNPGAQVSPAKEELLAVCNLQQVTLDRLFTSCPCKGQVRL